jgi:hypothetical protein
VENSVEHYINLVGVCIFIQENILFSNTDFDKLRKDKDLEICAVKLHLSTINIVMISIYMSLTGEFQYFLYNMESVLNTSYSNTAEIII